MLPTFCSIFKFCWLYGETVRWCSLKGIATSTALKLKMKGTRQITRFGLKYVLLRQSTLFEDNVKQGFLFSFNWKTFLQQMKIGLLHSMSLEFLLLEWMKVLKMHLTPHYKCCNPSIHFYISASNLTWYTSSWSEAFLSFLLYSLQP